MLRQMPATAARLVRLLCALLAMAAFACAADASAQGTPDNLRAKYAALGEQLKNNSFHRPLVLESAESPNNLKGDVYAVIDYPFAAVNTALNNPAHWCDVLILHLNIKYCKALGDASAPVLSVNLGKKDPQELKDTYHVDFKYRNETSTADYFSIVLGAASGPLNTSNYRIHLEAVAIDASHSFLHLTYSYDYGFAGKMAMKAYLATTGSGKIGFTRIGAGEGKSGYVSGVRGVVERNTMRYYLAIDAYLSAMSAAPSEQFEKRIQTWFSNTERYPQQLHELERGAYLDTKRAEFQRQNAAER
ncbi:hypothetical protein D9O50_00510 [Oxalobacteraceae bacterium CAVE-383]|nr:hypothetical protein D9O50_00510 [Oxalobacteraceae bacterium CAVE-383]